jgi:flagellar hook-length control protein FliK
LSADRPAIAEFPIDPAEGATKTIANQVPQNGDSAGDRPASSAASADSATNTPVIALPTANLPVPASAPLISNERSAVPLADVAVTIAAQAQSGKSRFDIRLDPPELGRIDVQLNVDAGGNVSSRLVVERPETFDLLRREAPQLERALQDAGLNTGNGMQFSLADQGFANRSGVPTAEYLPPPARSVAAEEPAPILASAGSASSSCSGTLDIRV